MKKHAPLRSMRYAYMDAAAGMLRRAGFKHYLVELVVDGRPLSITCDADGMFADAVEGTVKAVDHRLLMLRAFLEEVCDAVAITATTHTRELYSTYPKE